MRMTEMMEAVALGRMRDLMPSPLRMGKAALRMRPLAFTTEEPPS